MPAAISTIEVREGRLIVIFPKQPLLEDDRADDAPVPFHRVELHLENGRPQSDVLSFPLEVENVFLDHAEGGNYSFFPVGLRVAGGVRLSVEIKRGREFVKLALAEGDAAVLHIGGLVAVYMPSDKPDQDGTA